MSSVDEMRHKFSGACFIVCGNEIRFLRLTMQNDKRGMSAISDGIQETKIIVMRSMMIIPSIR